MVWGYPASGRWSIQGSAERIQRPYALGCYDCPKQLGGALGNSRGKLEQRPDGVWGASNRTQRSRPETCDASRPDSAARTLSTAAPSSHDMDRPGAVEALGFLGLPLLCDGHTHFPCCCPTPSAHSRRHKHPHSLGRRRKWRENSAFAPQERALGSKAWALLEVSLGVPLLWPH